MLRLELQQMAAEVIASGPSNAGWVVPTAHFIGPVESLGTYVINKCGSTRSCACCRYSACLVGLRILLIAL